MEESRFHRRRARHEGSGWLATALGAFVLLAVGFALGLVSGAAFEEPDLVLEHLAGRATETPLEGAELASMPEPAAEEPPPQAIPAPEPRARPLGAPRAQGEESPPARASPPPVRDAPPAAVAAPPPPRPPAEVRPRAGSFAVQVGAFAEERAAQELVRSLRGHGFEASVTREGEGGAAFKVRVGPVSSRVEAERLAARLQRERRLPTWVRAWDGG